MNEVKKIDIKSLRSKVSDTLQTIKPYSLLIFIAFVGVVYGVLFLQINSLTSAQPTSEAISSHIQASQTPHIDEAVVKQLLTLQDNSVNVQTLFDSARSNPFQ